MDTKRGDKTMRVFDNGCFFTVTCSRQDVSDFADTWPGSGFSDKAVTFQFDKSNGGLVGSNDQRNHPNADGGAMVALSDDAMHVGEPKMTLNQVFKDDARSSEPMLHRHPKHVAWMGGSPPRPYSEVDGTAEGAYVTKLFNEQVKVWEDHWRETCPADVRDTFWGRARHDAHATYRV